MSNSALAPGVVLRSPKREYTIRRVLGQGGFGITYLVDSPFKMDNITFKGKFAIKEHFLQILCGREKGTSKVSYMENSAGEVERSLLAFVAEAQRLQKLGINHRNIVEVSEVFECNNTAYYVMEYLEGESLASYVKGHGGRLTFAETAQLMRPICEAVAMLHANRVAHYDIKPQNIMIQQGDDGLRPVLIDFGLAKHYDGQGQATSSIAAAGYTPGYAPLEQYAGLRQFSPTADVYSLAATICFCLTGHTPAKADELNLDALCDELLSLGVEAAVANVLLQSLELRPAARPADAGVFTAALFQGVALSTARHPRSAGYSIPNAQPMSASPAPAPAEPVTAQPAASPRRRLLIPGIAASVIVVALIICLALGVFKKDPAEIEKERQAYWTEQGEELMNDFEVQVKQLNNNVPQTQEALQQAQIDFIREKIPGFVERGKAIISGYETDCPNRRETATIKELRQFVSQLEYYVTTALPAAQAAEEAPAAEEVPAAPAKEAVAEEAPAAEEVPATPAKEAVAEEIVQAPEPDKVYTLAMVDQKPEFPGGEAAMYKWLSDHITYPTQASEEGVQGRVIVEFDICKNGAIENVRVVRGRHPALDREAFRLVKSMPLWQAGRINGRPVKVTYTLPISFKLQQ